MARTVISMSKENGYTRTMKHSACQERKMIIIMARLIDADELEKVMTEDWFLEILAAQDSKSSIKKDIENMIDSVPLAYDVEKVVAKLEEERTKESVFAFNNINEPIPYTSADSRVYAYNKAIQIVKDGGSNAN